MTGGKGLVRDLVNSYISNKSFYGLVGHQEEDLDAFCGRVENAWTNCMMENGIPGTWISEAELKDSAVEYLSARLESDTFVERIDSDEDVTLWEISMEPQYDDSDLFFLEQEDSSQVTWFFPGMR